MATLYHALCIKNLKQGQRPAPTILIKTKSPRELLIILLNQDFLLSKATELEDELKNVANNLKSLEAAAEKVKERKF